LGLVAVVVPSPWSCRVQPQRWTAISVEVTEQGQVVQPGHPAFGPGDDVVDVAADGGCGAAGEGAVSVAFDDGAAQVGWDLLGGLAEVEGEAG
jgi:hypothetical protein